MKHVSCVALLGVVCGFLLVGCGGRAGSAFVVHRPDWPYEHYERIAVLPGQASDPVAQRDAEVLADRLTTMLTANGQFIVLSRAELREVFKEQDLSRLAESIDAGTALPEGQLKVAQAVIVPRITDYKLIAESERKSMPRILFDRHGRPYQAGEITFVEYRHGAEVEGSVRVVDAATGRILMSHTARKVPSLRRERDRPPSTRPEDIAAIAVSDLAAEFYKRVAPTEVEVKFDEGNLVIARDYFDGRFDEADKLPRGIGEFLVAVRDLPPACDGNEFRVAVSAADGRANLFESDVFVWAGSTGRAGVQFRVAGDPLREVPDEKYLAKLYSVGNPEPVVEREFRLVQEKGDD